VATIQERHGINGKPRYRVQVRLRGFPPQTATFERKTDAKEWARQTESDIKAGRYFRTNESKRHTVAQLIDHYLRVAMPRKRPSSQRSQIAQLNWWKKRLGHLLLADLTPAAIAEARDELAHSTARNRKELSPATVVRYLAALGPVLTMAVKELGWLDDTPMRKVTRPRETRGVIRFLSDDERTRLLEACKQSRDPYLYPIVVLALSTGMRRSEIMNLTWDRVDLAREIVVLGAGDTKNAEIRVVPVKGHAREVLGELRRGGASDSAFVFPAPANGTKGPKPIDIESAWRAALKRAEVKDFRFHDLRHSAASYLAMNGESPLVIAAVLGHKTLQMVKRYAHLSEAHTGAVVERMNRKLFGESKREGED